MWFSVRELSSESSDLITIDYDEDYGIKIKVLLRANDSIVGI